MARRGDFEVKIKGTEYIIFEESYVLGWISSISQFEIICDFCLTENHEYFKPPKREEFACFMKGGIRLFGYKFIQEIPQANYDPVWNKSINEYDDYSEIEDLQFVESSMKLMTDGFDFLLKFESISIFFNEQK